MSRVFHSKIVLCGDIGVGKTSIRRNYMGLSFDREHVSTLGADFALKKVNVLDDRVDLQIWDLGGQHGYEKLRSRYFSGSKGGLFVFDLTKRSSFENLEKWFFELWDCVPDKSKIPAIILGNKCDLKEETLVQDSEVLEFIDNFSEKHGLSNLEFQYFRTSAKDGINITDAFENIAEKIYYFLLKELGLKPSSV